MLTNLDSVTVRVFMSVRVDVRAYVWFVCVCVSACILLCSSSHRVCICAIAIFFFAFNHSLSLSSMSCYFSLHCPLFIGVAPFRFVLQFRSSLGKMFQFLVVVIVARARSLLTAIHIMHTQNLPHIAFGSIYRNLQSDIQNPYIPKYESATHSILSRIFFFWYW